MQGAALDAPNRLKQAWRWVYSLALYAFLLMSVWTLALVLAVAHSTPRQFREYKD
jgi:hypothetical protein